MRRVQRQNYERPHMRVVELRQHAPLICGSGNQGNSATMSVEYYEEDI